MAGPRELRAADTGALDRVSVPAQADQDPRGPDVAAGSSAHGVSRASRVAGRQARSAAVAVMGKGTLRPLCQGCSTLPGAYTCSRVPPGETGDTH